MPTMAARARLVNVELSVYEDGRRGVSGVRLTVVREEVGDGESAVEGRVSIREHNDSHTNETDPRTVWLEVSAEEQVVS